MFLALGLTLIMAGALWWGVVYYFVSRQNGESMWSSIDCLYSLSESCNFLRAMGWLRGINPYEPMVFWMGIVILIMSLLLRASVRNTDLQ